MKQNLPEDVLESMRYGLSDEEAISEGLVDPIDLYQPKLEREPDPVITRPEWGGLDQDEWEANMATEDQIVYIDLDEVIELYQAEQAKKAKK
ncbi:hypothetical protein [Gloeothece verrucosa]|uniref:Uncharacterized protein n=1 Tax=Gloeothece verrucosa (strain PCC 7822) TaxID=497965 RepID=E0UML1_GLOV7|nr:hypothetical protein [Gloeothece verrucosa]ADN18191.1 hypothetical protein Cyan7822_6407 [Gloeothece verrucosa PCC 7822]